MRDKTAKLCADNRIHFIQHEKNKGVPAAWNSLAKYGISQGVDIVCILNNDLLVSPQWLQTIVYALTVNPPDRIGSVFWEPIPVLGTRPYEQMCIMHDQLWHTGYAFTEGTWKPSWQTQDSRPLSYWESFTWGAHRCLSPNGTGFAFTKEVWNDVGEFDEAYISSHEESDFGVRCGKSGRFSLGIPYPRTFHAGSRTFIENPEHLPARERFRNAQQHFLQKWEVPADRCKNLKMHDHFKWVNEQFLEPIPKTTVNVLRPGPSATHIHDVEIPGMGEVQMQVLEPMEYVL